MQDNFYRQLLSRSNINDSVKEPIAPYQVIEERHAQILWFEQKYFRKLRTADGEEIDVLSPGLWNSGSGPDFKKAHLRIGGKELRGDVEVHLTDAGWKSHGHGKDSRYDDVVLHLSFWSSKTSEPLLTSSGRPLLQAYIQPALELPVKELAALIDIELYPYLEHTAAGKCAEGVFRALTPSEQSDFFESAAEWRLLTKARRLKQCAANDNEAFLFGACQALGYKNNAGAFARLYEALKNLRHLGERDLLSKALGLCGFFEDPYRLRWGSDPYYAELRSLQGNSETPSIRINLHQVRPLNHPLRRIAYLIKLLRDPRTETLFEQLFLSWMKMLSLSNEAPLPLEILPEYNCNYWETHYIFGSRSRALKLRFLGDQVQKTIFINAFLPLAHDRLLKNGNSEMLNHLKNVYRAVISNESKKRKYLTKRFFGKEFDKSRLSSAIHEQGALQLHADFCSRFETSCEGCPFILGYHKLETI